MTTTGIHGTNAVAHFDIAGPDLDALGDFYRSVLGWEPLPQGPGYTLLRTPDDGPNGALNEADAPAVTIGVAVDDLDQAVGSRGHQRQCRDAADRQRVGRQGAGA